MSASAANYTSESREILGLSGVITNSGDRVVGLSGRIWR